MLSAKADEIIKKISILNKRELEPFLGEIDGLYLGLQLSNMAKGYVLYRLNRLAEAAEYLCKAGLGQKDFRYIFETGAEHITGIATDMCKIEFESKDFGHIWETGYYKGCDGNWHDYDDGGGSSSSGGGGGGGDDCCGDSCLGTICIVAGVGTFCCSGKCIFDSCCGCDSFCGEDFCLDGCTVIGGGCCDSCC